MTRQNFQVLICVCFSVFALVSERECLSAQPQKPVTLEDIIQATRLRQERAKSLYINLTQRITDAKGSRTVPKEIRPKEQGDTIPSKDITYDSQTQIWIDGQKIRYAFDDYQWSEQEQNFISLPQISTFDGKLLKIFFTRSGTDDKHHPSGSIEKQKRHFVGGSLYLAPFFMTFRALDSSMRVFDLSQMTLTGRRAQIGGYLCYELQFQDPIFTTNIDYLWVDPSRDFVIPRYTETENGKLYYQIDVRFSPDKEVGWKPSEWNYISQFRDGRLEHSVKTKVIDLEINPAIPEEQFDISFPPGTFMRDFENGENFYIIRGDGSKRMVRGDELSLTYEQVTSADSSDLAGNSPSFINRWWKWIAAISLGGLLMAVYYAWKKKNKWRRGGSAIME